MIRLEVQEYCSNCLEFAPGVTPPTKISLNDGTVILTDTIVHCEHARRCEGIKRYLAKQLDDNKSCKEED